jgi:hypothetical protein
MDEQLINEVYRFCCDFFDENGFAPYQYQVARELQVSAPTVRRCLDYLWGAEKVVKGSTLPTIWTLKREG